MASQFKWERDTLFLNCNVSPGTQWENILKYSEYLWAVHLTNNENSINNLIKISANGGSLLHSKIRHIQDSDGLGGDSGTRQFFTRYSAQKPKIFPYDKTRFKYAILYKVPLHRGDVPIYVTLRHRQFAPIQGDVLFDFKTKEIHKSFQELVSSDDTVIFSSDEIRERLSSITSKATVLSNTFPEGRKEILARHLYLNIAFAQNDAVFNGIPPKNMIAGVFENIGTYDDPQFEEISDRYELLKSEGEEEGDEKFDFDDFYSLSSRVGQMGYIF